MAVINFLLSLEYERDTSIQGTLMSHYYHKYLTSLLTFVRKSDFIVALVSGNNSVVECNLAKVEVASSTLVSRSISSSLQFSVLQILFISLIFHPKRARIQVVFPPAASQNVIISLLFAFCASFAVKFFVFFRNFLRICPVF